MNHPTKKHPGARGVPQPANLQVRHAPRFKPVVAQLKTGVPAQRVKSQLAPPAFRPQPVPRVLQTKMAQRAAAPVQSKNQPAAPPIYRPQSKVNSLQRKTATHVAQRAVQKSGSSNTIQRASGGGGGGGAPAALMEYKQPAAGARMVVFCGASLNGVDLGKAWSRKSAYLAKGASEHAEDVIVDYIDWLETLLMFPSLAQYESEATMTLAGSLLHKKQLMIIGLTATPCSSTPRGEAKVATTTKKDKELGCTEKLIGLAKRGYSITIYAHHYYQGKVAGGKSASIEACEAMQKAGIKIQIGEG